MQASFAVTIPAGTTLVVRTLHNISSVDAPGKAVSMQLVKDVVVNGKVALPLGTKISGRIETSKRTRTPTRSQRLDSEHLRRACPRTDRCDQNHWCG